MKCAVCSYGGPALASEDSAGKPLNVCPKCQTPITPKPRPWEILDIPKGKYLATRPWKAAKMERKEFEKILAFVNPEAVESLKREAEAEALLNAMGLLQGTD